jgi:chemotaxis protein MotB
MASGGGGAWKVAYADFVTAMMAFFLVMWLVGQDKPVKEAIASYFNDPYGTSSKPGKSKNGMQANGGGPIASSKAPNKIALARPTIETAPKQDDDAERSRKATLPALHDNNKSTVGTLIAFVDESAELDDRAKQVLDKLIPDLQGKLSKIEIRGHASARPLSAGSGFQDAWQLSYARSLATMEYLAEKGIAPRRVRLSQSGIFEPVKFGHESGLPGKNARVEIYELNELADDPTATREPRIKGPKKPNLKRPAAAKTPTQSADDEGDK